ncbi:MAG: hypothetical protein LBT00_08800 [Spirochaetaceae bacterium]|nr:hypothetical protein [Spirochaetaceae bacterium]
MATCVANSDEAIRPRNAFTQAQRGALSRLLRSAMCRSLAMTGGLNPCKSA